MIFNYRKIRLFCNQGGRLSGRLWSGCVVAITTTLLRTTWRHCQGPLDGQLRLLLSDGPCFVGTDPENCESIIATIWNGQAWRWRTTRRKERRRTRRWSQFLEFNLWLLLFPILPLLSDEEWYTFSLLPYAMASEDNKAWRANEWEDLLLEPKAESRFFIHPDASILIVLLWFKGLHLAPVSV